MAADSRWGSSDRSRRLRWRFRGAWQWPTFAVMTVVDGALVHWLPLAGERTGLVPALLLVGVLNLMTVAVLGRLVGALVRRRRRDLPKVVADDYAGTGLILALAVVFLAIGLAHHPAVTDAREAFSEQSAAVRRWVALHGDAFTRAHVEQADTLRVDRDLFRTCVPSVDPLRWTCVIVDTSVAPPRVRPDTDRESNRSMNRSLGFR